VNNEESAIYMQCHCAGLPGTEDPRVAKAVKSAGKDPALKSVLARQQNLDGRNLSAIEQVMLPPNFLGKLAAEPASAARPLSGRAVFLQPVVLALLIAVAVLLGWGGVSLWNRAHDFPGKDNVMRMVEVNDEMTGMEMEPKKDTAGALNDWFFNKYGFEDYYLAPGFENYQAAGARLFKQDEQPVAQVAIPKHDMIFFSFRAGDFGVNLPNDQWRTFRDGEWVAAVVQHDDECFMVTFRGSGSEMDSLLQGLKK
jgi:hypothetical protein